MLSMALTAEPKPGYAKMKHGERIATFIEFMADKGVFGGGEGDTMPMSGLELPKESPLLRSSRDIALAAKRAFEAPDAEYTAASTRSGLTSSVLNGPVSTVLYKEQLGAKSSAYEQKRGKRQRTS